MSKIVPYFLNTVTWRFNIQKTGCCSQFVHSNRSLEFILDARVVCFTVELQWRNQDNIMLLPFRKQFEKKGERKWYLWNIGTSNIAFQSNWRYWITAWKLNINKGKILNRIQQKSPLVVGFYFITFFEQQCINFV